ncbi:glycosyltransferase family 2 protein [Nostoc sp. FACHB-280]|uniref:glycosyltransferase n=1 Tax=Nostoc sp. FACHB-280 TaxID=2692839 RepID=UPI00168BF476|nr:glycosyltransferase family 2 protein [Nostoc sp. FACHB-280]MBD2497651.1 glycosyltransferase family 2 protein [Nostoc sp. FACHB-280]
MSDIQISAIICTHNRDTYLGAAIDSLLAQDFAADFEVIVVDNNSSDRTREVVEQRACNPRLKYIFEPTTGLSVARNTGAKVARAEILAYLDDDAVASDRWLQVLYSAYQSNPKLAIAGGKVTLLWPPTVQAPKWLSSGLAGNLGAYDLGDKIVYIDQPGLTPRGLNYSIRQSFLAEIGGFDPHLGRVGKNLLSNEELQMTEFALQHGWQVAYLPEALVAHNVAPERLNRSWFLNRGWWQGISECYREQLAGKTGSSQLLRGSERLIRGLYKSLQYFSDPAERFDKLVYTYCQIGYLNAAIQGLLSTSHKK